MCLFVANHVQICSRKLSRDKNKEKSHSKPAIPVDSGYSGSVDLNPEGIATASGIDISLDNEERQGKYVVNDESSKKEEIQPLDAVKHKNPARMSDKRHKAKVPGKQAEADALKENEAKIGAAHEKKQFKKVERVLSAGEKDDSPRRRTSQKDKRKSGSHSSSPFEKVLHLLVWFYLLNWGC